jgi:hypothetical protein
MSVRLHGVSESDSPGVLHEHNTVHLEQKVYFFQCRWCELMFF